MLALTMLAAATGCITLQGYAGQYRQAGEETGPGVTPAAALVETLRETEADRARIVGDAERAKLFARCHFFRNQLLIASEKARYQIGAAASQVTQAAQQVERGFQESDEAFLAACQGALAGPVGQAFAKEQAAAGLD